MENGNAIDTWILFVPILVDHWNVWHILVVVCRRWNCIAVKRSIVNQFTKCHENSILQIHTWHQERFRVYILRSLVVRCVHYYHYVSYKIWHTKQILNNSSFLLRTFWLVFSLWFLHTVYKHQKLFHNLRRQCLSRLLRMCSARCKLKKNLFMSLMASAATAFSLLLSFRFGNVTELLKTKQSHFVLLSLSLRLLCFYLHSFCYQNDIQKQWKILWLDAFYFVVTQHFVMKDSYYALKQIFAKS